MYGFSCTVYLVGAHAEYTGLMEMPVTGDKNGVRSMLAAVCREVNAFMELEAQPGIYEVGVYVELANIPPWNLVAEGFWQLMGELNKRKTMTWKRSDTFALTPTEVSTNG